MATFVQNGRRLNEDLNIGKEYESAMIKIWTGRDEMVNYYNPCNRLNPNTLNTAGGLILAKVICCGDFNAHSTMWGVRIQVLLALLQKKK